MQGKASPATHGGECRWGWRLGFLLATENPFCRTFQGAVDSHPVPPWPPHGWERGGRPRVARSGAAEGAPGVLGQRWTPALPLLSPQVFQRREDGSVNFFRGWDAYREGFGKLTGEHWLGESPAHATRWLHPSTPDGWPPGALALESLSSCVKGTSYPRCEARRTGPEELGVVWRARWTCSSSGIASHSRSSSASGPGDQGWLGTTCPGGRQCRPEPQRAAGGAGQCPSWTSSHGRDVARAAL